MPNTETGFDLEQLKMDPRMWLRLATPLKDSDVLGNVFTEKENPFQKDPTSAMEKVKSLAADGKLYLRDLGRSRHFHKVEKDGDALKLGDKHEMRLANRATDPVLGLLMRISGAYFKWIGLERIGGWFEKKVEQRSAIKALDKQYKEEYKAMSDKQKSDLKKLRKEEKQAAKLQKRMDKLSKELEKTQNELNTITGQTNQTTSIGNKTLENNLGQQPPTTEQTLLQTQLTDMLESQEPLIDDDTDIQKEGILIDQNGEVVKSVEEEAIELQAFLDDPVTHKKVDPVIEAENVKKNLEDIFKDYAQENPAQPPNQGNGAESAPVELPFIDFAALKKQEYSTIQERLAQERQSLDRMIDWRDSVANSLFSHEEGADMKTFYESVQDDAEAGFDYLAGAVYGLLSTDAGGPDNKQQIMDALLNGQSVGNANNNFIRDGMTAYNNQVAALGTKEGREAFAKTLADVTLELGKQASREPNLSPRHMMIGRLISNAMTIADNHKLELPLQKNDWTIIRGAFNLANLSQEYYEARQYLGREDMNLDSARGRAAVNTLLAGQAVDKMIERDHTMDGEIKNTQLFMGSTWTSKSLQEMANRSEVRKGIGVNQVKTLLEDPHGLAALDIGKNLSTEIIADTMGLSVEKSPVKEKQMEKENVQQMEQPQFNPFG